jgi:hypothetical protein
VRKALSSPFSRAGETRSAAADAEIATVGIRQASPVWKICDVPTVLHVADPAISRFKGGRGRRIGSSLVGACQSGAFASATVRRGRETPPYIYGLFAMKCYFESVVAGRRAEQAVACGRGCLGHVPGADNVSSLRAQSLEGIDTHIWVGKDEANAPRTAGSMPLGRNFGSVPGGGPGRHGFGEYPPALMPTAACEMAHSCPSQHPPPLSAPLCPCPVSLGSASLPAG